MSGPLSVFDPVFPTRADRDAGILALIGAWLLEREGFVLIDLQEVSEQLLGTRLDIKVTPQGEMLLAIVRPEGPRAPNKGNKL